MGVMEKSDAGLQSDLKKGKVTVAVYGLGHVGIPLAIAWLMTGAMVIGVDVDQEKVEAINSGRSPVKEPGTTEAVSLYVKEGRLKASSDGVQASKNSDVKLIAVPVTTSGRAKAPMLDHLSSACEAIGEGLKRGDLVVLETSVPPGTTRGLVKSILEEKSGLRAEEDFGLAYSPERISEGRAIGDIVEAYPKVIGGIGPRSSRVASALYQVVSRKGVLALSSEVAAELEKLVEGIYRDVNIALANEIAGLCRSLGVDFEEVREAANSQPYSHLHRPGTGAGGMCLPVYPYLLMRVAKELGVKLPMTKLGRKTNEAMPAEVAALVEGAIEKRRKSPQEAKVSLLGVSFRGDVPDTRESPVYPLIRELRRRGVKEIAAHDPVVKSDDELVELGVSLDSSLEGVVKGADVLVVVTDHSMYKGMAVSELRRMAERGIAVVDGRDALDHKGIPEDSVYVGVGRPWSS